MATIDVTRGGTIGVSENDVKKHVRFANQVDFSIAANALIVTDLAQLISIPAGFFMTAFGVRLDVVQGAVATCVFGDATAANGWIATAYDLDGTALDTSISLPGDTFPALGGKLYHTADTIDLDPGHTVDAAKITCWATGYMIPEYSA
jgi:hypothetical protein